MKINLEAEWASFVDHHVKNGQFDSVNDVIQAGLRLLQQKEQDRQLDLNDLRAELDKGLASLDRGDYLALDDQGMAEYLEDVNKRGLERLAKRNASAT